MIEVDFLIDNSQIIKLIYTDIMMIKNKQQKTKTYTKNRMLFCY